MQSAIEALSTRNRASPDADVERELLRLRHEGFLALGRDGVSAAALPAPIDPMALDPVVGLPVARRLPSAETVRSTILRHGSLVVRGLLDAKGTSDLKQAVEMALAARGRAVSGEEPVNSSPWYAEFAPLKDLGARAFTASSGTLA